MSKKNKQVASSEPVLDKPEAPFSLEDISLEGFDLDALEDWAEEEKAGETERSIWAKAKSLIKRRFGTIVLIIFLAIAVFSVISGKVSRKGWSDWLGWFPSQGESEITLIDSQNGRILMTEVAGDSRRVFLETGRDASWLVVSRDDTTATNPAFSPEADRVAYLSEQNDGQIVIASVTEDERLIITANAVEIAALEEDLSRVHICPWSPIAWAVDGQHVAFFACRELLAFSLVVVADVSGSDAALSLIPDSKVDSSDQRQLQWLDESHLTVTTPSSNDSPNRVQTYSRP